MSPRGPHTPARLFFIAVGSDELLRISLKLVYRQLVTLREFGFALFWAAFVVVVAMWVLGLPHLHELLRSHSSPAGHERQSGTLAQPEPNTRGQQ